MAVTSTPTAAPERQVIRRTGYEPGALAGAFVGILIGMVVWLFGAKYTVDGLVLGCNMILGFFGVAYRVPMMPELYLWLAVFPLFFSLVEWTCSPMGRSGARHGGLILTWAVVVALDIITTVIGLRAGGGIPLVVWLASFLPGLALLTGILTFGPEWLIKSCWGLLARAARAIFKR